MDEAGFQSMIKRKTDVLTAMFEKYFTENYFEKIQILSLTELTRDLRETISDEFNKTICDIFLFAREKKIETEHLIEQKKKDLESYARQVTKSNFELTEESK